MKRFFSELRLYVCNRIVGHIPSHRLRLWFYRNIMKMEIGERSSVHMNCKFDFTKNFCMGKHSIINPGCRLDNRGFISIGDNVSISQDVIILTADHDLNSTDFSSRVKKVIIEDYVWIGTRAMILPGVVLQKGSVIAAGAVVTKNVSAYSVVAGIPAKLIGSRSRNLNYTLYYRRLFQ